MADYPVNNNPDGAADRGPKVENSVVDVLFDVHMQKESPEHDNVKQCFRDLFVLLDNMSYDDLEAVTDAVCKLCETCEYAGFVGGMKSGIQLARELNIL